MSRPYRRGGHTKHDLKVHLVWVTKYRYTVMRNGIGERLREIIRQVCHENDIQIIKGRVSLDHIHLYVSYPPKLSVSKLMQKIKGRSSKMIQAEYPELGQKYWGRHFWAVGYAAFSSGHVDDQMIRDYLDNHSHSQDSDDDFVVDD